MSLTHKPSLCGHAPASRMPGAKVTLLLVVLSVTGGCASYRQRVVDDLRDTFKAKVGTGLGLYAQAKATSYLDAGLGWGGYWQNVGFESRYTELVHPGIDGCPFPFGAPETIPRESSLTVLRMANIRDTTRTSDECEYAVVGQLLDASAVTKWNAYGVEKRSPHQLLHNKDVTYTERPLGCEVGVGLFAVNARVGFDTVEFCDLICTTFGYDLLRDNPQRAWKRRAVGDHRRGLSDPDTFADTK